jgi:hypothetical protein
MVRGAARIARPAGSLGEWTLVYLETRFREKGQGRELRGPKTAIFRYAELPNTATDRAVGHSASSVESLGDRKAYVAARFCGFPSREALGRTIAK